MQHTNCAIEAASITIIKEGKELQSYHHHTDIPEMKAFIAILYFSGLWKSSHVNNEQLWSKKNGITFYRCVMPLHRFLFLSTCLRFDDKVTRDKSDKFAAIKTIWDIFIANCTRSYTPHRDCTVDEQLLGFRGRCSFRVYMKSKPDKYGLKLMSLNDSNTSYMVYKYSYFGKYVFYSVFSRINFQIFAMPYLGKQSTAHMPKGKIPDYFLRDMTASIHNTGRTVTCDNWFTSIPIMETLLKEPYKLSVTGTVRKNKRQIPAELKVASQHPPGTKFCYSPNMTLLSHTSKKNKIVLVASSFMHSSEIDSDGKPAIIAHYNATKGGTDMFDQLCHAYTVSRRTNRWPVRVFFGMLDQAAVNARILLKCKLAKENVPKKITAQFCLERIYLHLARDHLSEKYTTCTLREDLKAGIAGILSVPKDPSDTLNLINFEKRQRCRLCKRGKDAKTVHGCPSCERPMCGEHRSPLCVECGNTD